MLYNDAVASKAAAVCRGFDHAITYHSIHGYNMIILKVPISTFYMHIIHKFTTIMAILNYLKNWVLYDVKYLGFMIGKH